VQAIRHIKEELDEESLKEEGMWHYGLKVVDEIEERNGWMVVEASLRKVMSMSNGISQPSPFLSLQKAFCPLKSWQRSIRS
jgi:hypothetical protein